MRSRHKILSVRIKARPAIRAALIGVRGVQAQKPKHGIPAHLVIVVYFPPYEDNCWSIKIFSVFKRLPTTFPCAIAVFW